MLPNTVETLRVDFALCRPTLAGKWQKFRAPSSLPSTPGAETESETGVESETETEICPRYRVPGAGCSTLGPGLCVLLFGLLDSDVDVEA